MSVTESSTRELFAERLMGVCIGALDLLHVHVGSELGLYHDFWRFYRLHG
jgi:hypothetical protein